MATWIGRKAVYQQREVTVIKRVDGPKPSFLIRDQDGKEHTVAQSDLQLVKKSKGEPGPVVPPAKEPENSSESGLDLRNSLVVEKPLLTKTLPTGRVILAHHLATGELQCRTFSTQRTASEVAKHVGGIPKKLNQHAFYVELSR